LLNYINFIYPREFSRVMEVTLDKLFPLAKKIIKIRLLGDKKPLKLAITPTLNCNARCRFCNIWKYHHKNELNLDFYEKLFKTLKKDVFWLHVTGGEPFLSPILCDIIRLATKELDNLFMININSNGTIPIDKLKPIIEENPRVNFFLSFGLDGDFEFHKERKGLTDSQIKILKKNIELAKRWYKELKNFDYEVAYLLPTPNEQILKERYKNHSYACFPSNSDYYHNNDIKINNDKKQIIKHINKQMKELPLSIMGIVKRISLFYSRKAFSNKILRIRYYPYYLVLDSHGKVFTDIFNYKPVGDFSKEINFSKLNLPKKVKLSPLSCDNLFYFLH